MALVHHVTPITPNDMFKAVMPGRAAMVSFYRRDQVDLVEATCPYVAYDNGRFSSWIAALRAGKEWSEEDRDPAKLYGWLEQRLFMPGRWAIIPDIPGAPSQLNDAELLTWPFGTAKGAPVWHMDGPIARLGRLCEKYPRVCIGWVGHPKKQPVGCAAFRRRMDDVQALFGNRWPNTHMLRGVSVGGDYPFVTVDSSSFGQNGHKHDWKDDHPDLYGRPHGKWSGRRNYCDHLEAVAA